MYIPSYSELKSNIIRAYQRAVRGCDYSIRNGWGIEGYFTKIIPEIKIFCERYLENKELCKYNNHRANIFKHTLKLIEEYEKMTYKEELKNENQLTKLFEYISKNMGWVS